MECILPVTINVWTDRLSPIAKIDLISKESRSFLGQVGHYIVQKQGAAWKIQQTTYRAIKVLTNEIALSIDLGQCTKG